MKKPTTVKEYIRQVPLEHRKDFIEFHELICAAAPDAVSCISYGMPALKLYGIVVYYANWEKHMAIYPMPSALKAFASSLNSYVTSKSTIQFPHGKRIPKKLIRDIVAFRVEENILKQQLKKKR
ncbi:MAG: iron chaperone [Bacteroidota bacterium]